MSKIDIISENLGKLQPLDEDDLDAWWRTIPGARGFLNAVFEAFNRKCAIAANLPESDVDGFIQALEGKIQRKDSNSPIERFEYDFDGDVEDFVEALTNEFAPNFIRNFNKDAMTDLAKQNPFSSYAAIIIRLKVDAPWLTDAVTEFNRSAKKFGAALIFISTAGNPSPSITRIEDYLTPYDIQFFAINLLADAALPARKKMYTSTLAEKLSGQSAVLAKNLARAELYSYGLDFVRTLLPDFDERVFARAVWECQVQFLLPTLEQIREQLILRNESKLRVILPKQDEFGTILEEPFDMELRHLHYYGGRYKLFQLDEWELLELAYNARNDLSHLKTIEFWELEKLFTFAD